MCSSLWLELWFLYIHTYIHTNHPHGTRYTLHSTRTREGPAATAHSPRRVLCDARRTPRLAPRGLRTLRPNNCRSRKPAAEAGAEVEEGSPSLRVLASISTASSTCEGATPGSGSDNGGGGGEGIGGGEEEPRRPARRSAIGARSCRAPRTASSHNGPPPLADFVPHNPLPPPVHVWRAQMRLSPVRWAPHPAPCPVSPHTPTPQPAVASYA